jgi:TonB-linked SusC/RagA family outer membrane protein
MKHKHLLKNITLIIICTCATTLLSIAQKKTMGSPSKVDSLSYNDSLVKSRVNLPLNITVSPNSTTASTQAVYTPDLIKQPVTNVLNALTGQLAGLYSLQSSGQPGADAVSLTLRGRTPIILIDGIPRSLTYMDLEEVESVTVLKDAMATAMLGVRGANGAILITTKRGAVGAQQISFTAQSAFQQPIGLLKPLGAFDYATLRNEAVANEISVNPNFSTGLLYSPADLIAFQNHTDPIGHPDVNWYNQVLKTRAQLNRYTLSISGGNITARYFTTVEHLYQDGLFNSSSINTYNTNEYYSQYLIRTNVDLNITKKLTAGIHLLGSIANENEPGVTTATVFNSFLTTPSNAYNVYNTNGTYGGNTQFINNIQGQTISSGYQQNYTRNILADFYVKRTLDEITPGMYAKASASYTSTVNENINRSKPVVAFQQTGTGSTATYGAALTATSAQINTNTISGTTGVAGVGQYRQIYTELATGWNRTFNDKHNFDVELLANSDSKNDGANLAYTVQGISAHASYNYKQKYIAEVAEAYNGSNYYPTGDHFKYGFFPVVGLGWVITKEDFLKSYTWLNTLKLSANYGRTGNDNPGYFVYLQRYNNAGTPFFGTSAGANTSLAEATLANPNITYEKANKLNISLQGSLLNDRLGFTVDYYNNQFSDLLIQRGQNTSLIGNTYPNENIGQNQYTGFEFQLSWQPPKVNGIGYYISLNAGFQQSKVVYSNEVTQPYPYMQRTGQKVGQAFGYVAAGLFQNQADIANAKQNGVGVVAGYTPQPGDIKYVDQNGDGVINQFDQVAIGPKGPLITYGANLGFSFKGLDISALLQGVANYDVNLGGNSYFEFQNNGLGQAYQQQLGRFTPATAATATYPRLSIGTNSNNQAFSTYFFRKADFMRLKNLQVGFTFPTRYANAIAVKSLRLFVNGTNLFTVTSLKGGLDPEDYNGLYPIQRLLNLGITVKL